MHRSKLWPSLAFGSLLAAPALSLPAEPQSEGGARTRVVFAHPGSHDPAQGGERNGDLRLNVHGEPVLGETVEVALSTDSSLEAASLLIGLEPAQISLPNGTPILVEPATAMVAPVTLTGGAGSFDLGIPNDPARSGMWVFTQYAAIDGGEWVSSELAGLRIGDTREFPSFDFQDVVYAGKRQTFDDATDFGTVDLDGHQLVSPEYRLDGTVSIKFASGAAGSLTCISHAAGTDMFVEFGSALLTVRGGTVLWNGYEIGSDDELIREAMDEIDLPEDQWSDLTRAIVGWGHVIASPEYNRNDRIAQRMARTYGLLGTMADPCAATIFATKAWVGKKVAQLCAEIKKLCNSNGGKHFCDVEPGTGRVLYWIELDPWFCDLVDTLCTVGGAVIVYKIGQWMEWYWTGS